MYISMCHIRLGASPEGRSVSTSVGIVIKFLVESKLRSPAGSAMRRVRPKDLDYINKKKKSFEIKFVHGNRGSRRKGSRNCLEGLRPQCRRRVCGSVYHKISSVWSLRVGFFFFLNISCNLFVS